MLRSTIPRKEGVWDIIKLVEACERVLQDEENWSRPYRVGVGKAWRTQWRLEIEQLSPGLPKYMLV
jgi:hypothetical protein